jgi:protein-L-isoaspartate(D-aspartate) O-methyltransferase
MTTTTPDDTAEQLHQAMIAKITGGRYAHTQPVIDALKAVPRHVFLPNATLAEAYHPGRAVITKRSDDGTNLSCASVPTLVATMLERLHVQPGHRVFECGAGTGYNAALLDELTGLDGTVVTADIDAEVADGAQVALTATGHDSVVVLTRDGTEGASEQAPFDRIEATVGVWDIPATWFDQLNPGGRMVLPLRWRGQTRGVALVMGEDGVLRSDAVFLCGFVPMIGQDGERKAAINTDPAVYIHYDIDQGFDPVNLDGILHTPRQDAWSGVPVGTSEPVDGIWLRATATDPAVCRIEASPAAFEAGLCRPVIKNLSPVLVEGDSLAYLAYRRIEAADGQIELGATGHGSHGEELAQRMCEHIRTWNLDRQAKPHLTAMPCAELQEVTINAIVKKECVLTVTY